MTKASQDAPVASYVAPGRDWAGKWMLSAGNHRLLVPDGDVLDVLVALDEPNVWMVELTVHLGH